MSQREQPPSSSTRESPMLALGRSPQVGTPLHFSEVEKGLRELNPDVSVDAPERRPSEYRYALDPAPDVADRRPRQGGVYYLGRFVCAIDREVIPEFKLYDLVNGLLPIDMVDAERYDDSRIFYVEVLRNDPFYEEAAEKARRHDDNYTFEGGKLFRFEAMRETKIRGPVRKVGWRHTFEALLRADIPGVSRETLGEKFGVDLYKVPIGSPEEIDAALHAE